MFLTDEGCLFACGSNADNKLALNNRRGFIAAMRNIFTRVGAGMLGLEVEDPDPRLWWPCAKGVIKTKTSTGHFLVYCCP